MWLLLLAARLALAGADGETSDPPPGDAGSPPPLRPVGWAILPATDYSTDDGLGLGVYGALYLRKAGALDDGVSKRIMGQIYWSTGGVVNHFLEYDLPGLFDRGLRWSGYVGVERWDHGPYYPPGWASLVRPCDQDPAAFWEVGLDSVRFQERLRVPVAGDVAVFGGFDGRFAEVDVFPGSALDQVRPPGVEGGFYSQATLGLLLDSRNTEPSTTAGSLSEISVRGGGTWTGSTWSSGGLHATDQRYLPLDRKHRVVLAHRTLADVWFGHPPFFERPRLGGSQDVAVGGSDTLRGYAEGRFSGDVALLTDTELRWTFADLRVWRNRLELFLVPFVDLGLFWNADPVVPLAGEPAPTVLARSGGAGFRFAWNRDFVVRFDFGYAGEPVRSLDAAGCAGGEEGRTGLGVYVLTDHPF